MQGGIFVISPYFQKIKIMKPEYIEIPLIKNEDKKRFELEFERTIAFINYKERDGKITLTHTEVPLELEGKGTGNAIVEKTLDYLEQNNYTLVPLCPFVFAYIKRHPEWKRIIDPDFKMEI